MLTPCLSGIHSVQIFLITFNDTHLVFWCPMDRKILVDSPLKLVNPVSSDLVLIYMLRWCLQDRIFAIPNWRKHDFLVIKNQSKGHHSGSKLTSGENFTAITWFRKPGNIGCMLPNSMAPLKLLPSRVLVGNLRYSRVAHSESLIPNSGRHEMRKITSRGVRFTTSYSLTLLIL